LICTAYPPKSAGEKPVNNDFDPVKSRLPENQPPELFTAKSGFKKSGE
jgi:hypothetical protein